MGTGTWGQGARVKLARGHGGKVTRGNKLRGQVGTGTWGHGDKGTLHSTRGDKWAR